MNGLHFDFAWETPLAAVGPELRATWAHLVITVNGIPVTQVHDYKARSVRDGIYLPLYPLAEWLAMNWWPLLYEMETPRRLVHSDYARRHNIRFSREGFALPDLTVRPVGGEQAFMEWKTFDPSGCAVRFLQQGSAVLEVAQVREAFASLINGVVNRLECEGIIGAQLQEEWQTIGSVDREESEFCEAAATLGLDPYGLSEDMASSIIRVNGMLPVELLQEFFPAADAYLLEDEATSLLAGIHAVHEQTADLRALKKLKRDSPKFDTSRAPWQDGYAFARTLRKKMKLEDRIAASLDDVGAFLGVDPVALHAAMPASGRIPAYCDAIVAENGSQSPGFIIGKQRESSRTFILCRGIFEYLTSASSTPLLITGIQSERQKRNRAFAAEFLAPAALLRKRVVSDAVYMEDVEELAEEFHVSPYVIAHQLENHRLARIVAP